MSGETDREAALNAILAELGADSGTLHLLGADGLLHLAAAVPPMPEAVLEKVRTISVGKGMAGLAVERRAPVDSCNIQTDATGDVKPGAKLTGLQGAVVVPVFDGDTVVGALGVGTRRERSFTEAETARLTELGRELAAKRTDR